MNPAFLDTNVCVYAYDTTETRKRRIARALAADSVRPLVVSTQVLQEFFNVVTRRLPATLSHEDAAQATRSWAELPVVASDAGLIHRAVQTVAEHQLSIWDALIIEAAVRGGCDVLYTEDLNAGSTIRGVKIIDPFG